MKNKIIMLAILLTTISFLSSCSKEDKVVKNTSKANNKGVLREANSVVCKDGVLIFSGWDAFYQNDNTLSNYTFEERQAWEDALNFKSQKQVFDNIASNDYAIFITPYENMPDSYFLDHPEPNHCAEYYKAINDGIIEELYDDGRYMAYTVKDISKVAYINNDGFVKIDSILYQYKGELKKYMINGTIQDCGLLNSVNVTNEDLGIIVTRVQEGSKGGEDWNPEDPFYKIATTPINQTKWVYDGKFRVSCETSVEIKGHINPNLYEYTFQLDCKPLIITLNSERKNGWGNWIPYHGEYNVSGSTSVVIEECVMGTGYPPYTYPHYPDFMLNFQTIHGNTNSGFFPVTIYQNMVYYNGIVWPDVLSRVFYCRHDINPIHFNIDAGIAGGAHGITVNNKYQ